MRRCNIIVYMTHIFVFYFSFIDLRILTNFFTPIFQSSHRLSHMKLIDKVDGESVNHNDREKVCDF